MTPDELRSILRIAQDLSAHTAPHHATKAPCRPSGPILLLALSPTPPLRVPLEHFGAPPQLIQALQATFDRLVGRLRAEVLTIYSERVPGLQTSLAALQLASGDAHLPVRILEQFSSRLSTRFSAGVSDLQSLLLNRVEASLARPVDVKPATAFTKGCIETLRKIYLINPYPNPAEIRVIADKIAMDHKQVRVWFQNRRNRKAVSARGIKEELRIAEAHGIVPPESYAKQVAQAERQAAASAAAPAKKKKKPASKRQASQKPSQPSRPSQQQYKPQPAQVFIRREYDNYDSSGGSSGGSDDGMDVDGFSPAPSARLNALDGVSFDYHDAPYAPLGHGRPPAGYHHPHHASTSPAPHSASTSSMSFSTQPPLPSSSSHGQWSYDAPRGPSSHAATTPDDDDHWNLVPIQPDYYLHQAPAHADGSLLYPPQHTHAHSHAPQRSPSFGSTSSASSSSLSDLDSLWSIASTDSATTYSTFSAPPCVPTDLDFTPPPPSDEITLAVVDDPLLEPPEYLLSAAVPAFSFLPSPPPAVGDPPGLGGAGGDFSAEAFQALLDSSSSSISIGGGGVDGGADGALWGNGSDVLELTDEIDQVLREFSPDGGAGTESFSLFDFNIPAPAATW